VRFPAQKTQARGAGLVSLARPPQSDPGYLKTF
jgi:hypothetical protein